MGNELYYLVFELSTMEDDPQYSMEELSLLAELLINEENDLIKQINYMKSKELD
jgi:hypothetical protein